MKAKCYKCARFLAGSYCDKDKQNKLPNDGCLNSFVSIIEAKELNWVKVKSNGKYIKDQYRSDIVSLEIYFLINVYDSGDIAVFVKTPKVFKNLGNEESLESAKQKAQKYFNRLVMSLLE